MNQKGETTLFVILLLVVMSGLLTLCGLELERSFRHLKNRTSLFLCVKQSKGELNEYLKFIGRTNWALENIKKAQLVAIFVPGLQAVALDAQKAIKLIKIAQDSKLFIYLKKLNDLRNQGCPVDPRLLITPFELGSTVHKRGLNDVVLLRSNKWNYHYLKIPFAINLEIRVIKLNSLNPQIEFYATEKMAKLSSLYSSQ